jgi:hypothetical protein
MSDAVEGAELILLGVSEKYKERCARSPLPFSTRERILQ